MWASFWFFFCQVGSKLLFYPNMFWAVIFPIQFISTREIQEIKKKYSTKNWEKFAKGENKVQIFFTFYFFVLVEANLTSKFFHQKAQKKDHEKRRLILSKGLNNPNYEMVFIIRRWWTRLIGKKSRKGFCVRFFCENLFRMDGWMNKITEFF